MTRNTFQISLGALLVIVACVAVNFWLFRLGFFWGIVGLNVSKHVLTAYLCQTLGVNRGRQAAALPEPVVPATSPAAGGLPAS